MRDFIGGLAILAILAALWGCWALIEITPLEGASKAIAYVAAIFIIPVTVMTIWWRIFHRE